MTSPYPPQGSLPVHVYQNNTSVAGAPQKSATGSGIISLVLAASGMLTAPLLLLIPYVGFVPALIAGAGIIVAWTGLRGATSGTGLAVTGIIASVIVFATLAGIATVWNLVIAGPAVNDYDELHDVIDYITSLIFGS
ncbi:hypothetical protein NQ038_09730 [Brevibacterium sp. 50QC2O2]|uniref:hypothetical protein n=1 Tax=Brevibacterium TaxID=1696 RepID=UPI00211BA246|nr:MULTISPECIES: hypothetical protein [unclassified Brevibacterium]MCQ9384307.1 hypothetical protein [Brevibacterium sp. 68QC2CO]MCQ9388926.1 hypothetical protein [Brevibacterium sp. 50QC2O2]